jgi:type I restriction enzyme M protein
MNMFMHGIEEFSIARGNTLSEPAFLANDTLKTFNVILANPPYSIKAWDRTAFENDPWGRNMWGTPPQGCADYAFQQHIQKSLDPKNGRSISLWPQGLLDRNTEQDIRRQMIESDTIEAVIGLGRNLFYNSGMESCLVVTNNNKDKQRAGRILIINGSDLVRKEKTISFLEDQHIQAMLDAYESDTSIDGLSEFVSIEELSKNNFSLNISLYVNKYDSTHSVSFEDTLTDWAASSKKLSDSMASLFQSIGGDVK